MIDLQKGRKWRKSLDVFLWHSQNPKKTTSGRTSNHIAFFNFRFCFAQFWSLYDTELLIEFSRMGFYFLLKSTVRLPSTPSWSWPSRSPFILFNIKWSIAISERVLWITFWLISTHHFGWNGGINLSNVKCWCKASSISTSIHQSNWIAVRYTEGTHHITIQVGFKRTIKFNSGRKIDRSSVWFGNMLSLWTNEQWLFKIFGTW